MRPIDFDVVLRLSAVLAATIPSGGACVSHTQVAVEPHGAVSDSALFSAVVRRIVAEPVGPVRVDPRPLRPDPNLVTLHPFDVMPDRVPPEAQERPLAQVDSAVHRRRVQALAAAGIPQTDALNDALCPGAMIPPSPSIDARRRQTCPSEHYRSVIIALPRAGAAYWPLNFDERSAHGDAEAWSVRVIHRNVSPRGSVEASADYVFARQGNGGWTFLKKRPLLIIE